MTGLVEFGILCLLLYWLFYPRCRYVLCIRNWLGIRCRFGYNHWIQAHIMLDTMCTSVQNVYAKWGSTSEVGYRTMAHRDRRRAPSDPNKPFYDVMLKKKTLADIKEEPNGLPFFGPRYRPFAGLRHCQCSPNSANPLENNTPQRLTVRNVLLVDSHRINKGLVSRAFCHLLTVYQLRKYDYPQVSETVLRDERLKAAIEEAASQDLEDENDEGEFQRLLAHHQRRARAIVYGMRSTLSDFLLRLTSWVLYKLLPIFLTSVVSIQEQVEMLRAAGKTGLPLIFLPLHRSHLDYILISFILLNNDIRSPLVAAGDNLRIPVFGWLLRGLGAFFIKRRLQGRKDPVYRAALHTYMVECLRAGHNLEFFVEGGRTRTGKACLPKGGLLSVIVDAYMDGTVADALLVPVSVNYEKLVDGNFVREELGQPKQMETFSSAVRAIWSVLNSNYGVMRIDFNQPFSLRELVTSFHQQNRRRSVGDPRPLHTIPSSASLYGTDMVAEEHRQLVDTIARHVVHDCASATAIMSTNAVALLLLYRFRTGTTLGQLVKALGELRAELRAAGKDSGFTGENLDVVNHAVDLLGPGLVRRERGTSPDGAPTVTLRPVVMLPNVIELSYYSNATLAAYSLEAVLATALYSLVGPAMYLPESARGRVRQDELLQAASTLCSVLQFEFIFTRPCEALEDALLNEMTNLCQRKVLHVFGTPIEDEERPENEEYRRPRRQMYDDDEFEAPPVEYEVCAPRDELVRLELLHRALRPLVDTYTASALGLAGLVGRQVPEAELATEMLAEVKAQLERGYLHYGESLAIDPIKNSFKLFERWNVLECHVQDGIKLFYLSLEFDNDKKIAEVFDTIKAFKWTVYNTSSTEG